MIWKSYHSMKIRVRKKESLELSEKSHFLFKNYLWSSSHIGRYFFKHFSFNWYWK